MPTTNTLEKKNQQIQVMPGTDFIFQTQNVHYREHTNGYILFLLPIPKPSLLCSKYTGKTRKIFSHISKYLCSQHKFAQNQIPSMAYTTNYIRSRNRAVKLTKQIYQAIIYSHLDPFMAAIFHLVVGTYTTLRQTKFSEIENPNNKILGNLHESLAFIILVLWLF